MSEHDWDSQHEPRFRAIYDLLAGVPNDVTILDVGVEPYQLSSYLLERLPEDITYHGMAYGEENKKWTRTVAGQKISVHTGNVEEEWPLEDDTVDYVIMGAILEHLFDPLTALKEARRVTKPDGALILSTPNATRLIQRIRLLLGRNIWDGFAENPYHRHNHEWSAHEIKDISRPAGWRITDHDRIALHRSGLPGRLLEFVTSMNPGWNDQHILRMAPTEPKGSPTTYRESLVARGE